VPKTETTLPAKSILLRFRTLRDRDLAYAAIDKVLYELWDSPPVEITTAPLFDNGISE
jgi:hypothetical protein